MDDGLADEGAWATIATPFYGLGLRPLRLNFLDNPARWSTAGSKRGFAPIRWAHLPPAFSFSAVHTSRSPACDGKRARGIQAARTASRCVRYCGHSRRSSTTRLPCWGSGQYPCTNAGSAAVRQLSVSKIQPGTLLGRRRLRRRHAERRDYHVATSLKRELEDEDPVVKWRWNVFP